MKTERIFPLSPTTRLDAPIPDGCQFFVRGANGLLYWVVGYPDVSGGALVVRDTQTDAPKLAFAPGAWVSFFFEDDHGEPVGLHDIQHDWQSPEWFEASK